MLHAHFVNIGKPWSYSQTFNSIMKANNLPTLNIPEEPPSFEIISKLSEGGTNEKEMDTSQDEEEVEISQRSKPSSMDTTQDTIFIQGKRKY